MHVTTDAYDSATIERLQQVQSIASIAPALYTVTADDHIRHAMFHRETAAAMFRNRWKRLSDKRPRKGVWRSIDRDYDRNGYLGLVHYTCATARGHAQLARELVAPLRPVGFKP